MKFKILVLLFLAGHAVSFATPGNLKKIVAQAEKHALWQIDQVTQAASTVGDKASNGKKPEAVFPRSLTPDGNLIMVPAKDWTSGFFPGTLWLLYELSGNEVWKTQAATYTSKIENEKWNSSTHDMGFKIGCSFGNGFRLTGNKAYREVIIRSAITLSKRFNPNTGCIRSWDHNKDKWAYPVIIDNMMNLELLFDATRLTNDSSFYKIAVSHAGQTIKNHFRNDFSSYHVVDYDTITGEVLKKTTHQGFSNESAWSRGQAWGLYGFTMCYRETSDKKYLEQAEKIAGFILNHPNLPKDLVPYWDFNAPNIPHEPRDASAAAIIASALFELSRYSSNGDYFRKIADRIMENLTKGYRSPMKQNRGFILIHSTGSRPAGSEVDVPLNYADYYYLEALQRQKMITGK